MAVHFLPTQFSFNYACPSSVDDLLYTSWLGLQRDTQVQLPYLKTGWVDVSCPRLHPPQMVPAATDWWRPSSRVPKLWLAAEVVRLRASTCP